MKSYNPTSLKSAPHDSAKALVKGEAPFIDDRIPAKDEVIVGLYLSPLAHGKIQKIDLTQALLVEGICGIWSGKDFSHNSWGPIFSDQPLLPTEEVNYIGEPLLIIAAENKLALDTARDKIKIKFSSLPSIFSIDEAIENKSFISEKRQIKRGNVANALKNSKHKITGEFFCEGQDHFYLESHAALAFPEEMDRLTIYSSTQHPSEVQHVVAHALGLPFHQVVCVVHRMGGGFGGKESQSAPFGAYAALVAQRLKRSARLVLTKDEDMLITGKRHPYKFLYQMGFDSLGNIKVLNIKIFSNGGAYADLSTAIMERAMLHIDNAYFIPHILISGQVCKTNLQPNTAFRGFGGPQAVACIENLMEEISQHLKIDALSIRKKNCYQQKSKNITPYGQKLSENALPELFLKLEKSSQYHKRRKEIDIFNSQSSLVLKGLALTAVKFGISFTNSMLNQGSALVQVLRDGSVQVSTGATEMGQGVNTKIAQVVAQSLDIPLASVRVMATSTEKNVNTSPTAASSGSDINAKAALMACEKIKLRLKNVQKKLSKKVTFSTLINEAYCQRINLSEFAYFKTPNIFFDRNKGQGKPFFYFTCGVAASEISIDRLTGEMKVLRSDILMDLGRPINHHIDWGQTSGAFVQGLGWISTEKLFWDQSGKLLTHSPTTYKIPSIQDIPRDFRIHFLDNPFNTKNIRGSKAVGEPPLLLAASVFCAIKNALSYVDKGQNLKIPATLEEIFFQLNSQD